MKLQVLAKCAPTEEQYETKKRKCETQHIIVPSRRANANAGHFLCEILQMRRLDMCHRRRQLDTIAIRLRNCCLRMHRRLRVCVCVLSRARREWISSNTFAIVP